MTIHVEPLHFALARVTCAPSLVARIVLGRTTTERYAARVGGRWLWDGPWTAVEPAVERALREAYRQLPFRHAIEPPG